MFQPWIALTRTYVNRSLLSTIPTIGMMIAAPWLFARLIGLEPGWSESDANPLGMYFCFVGFSFFVAGLAAWSPLSDFLKGTRFGTLPLSTPSLAAFLWLMPACLVLATSLILQYAYRLVFGTDWPVLTTTLSLQAFCMMCLALGYWLTDLRGYRILAAPTLVISWIVWFVSRFFPAGFSDPPVLWASLTFVDGVVLAATAVGACCLQHRVYRRIRCGEARLHWLYQMTEADLPVSHRTKRRPAVEKHMTPPGGLDAVCGEIGRRVTRLAAVFFSVLATPMVIGVLTDGDSLRGAVVFVLLSAGLISFLVGIGVSAALVWSGSRLTMRPWLASLPFSDTQIAVAIGKATLKSTGIVLLIVLSVVTVIGVIWIGLTDEGSLTAAVVQRLHVSDDGPVTDLTLIVAAAGGVWVVTGVVASVAAAGRTWIAAVAYHVVLGVPFVRLILAQIGGSTADMIGDSIVMLAALLVVGTTIAAVAVARHRDLIQRSTVTLCALLMAAGTLAAAGTVAGGLYNQIVAGCAASLLALPVASLPLAVNWNRHR